MGKIIMVDELKLVNRINYLTGLRANYPAQEEIKKDAIGMLNWIFTISINCFKGKAVEKDKIDKEIDWLELEMARYDVLEEYEMASRYCARVDEINWVVKNATEIDHPSETSRPETLESTVFMPGASTWTIDQRKLGKRHGPFLKKNIINTEGWDNDYPNFHS